MPKLRVTIEKFLPSQNEYWTNVYWVPTASVGDAMTIAQQLVTAERAILHPLVTVTKARIDDAVPDSDVGGTVVFNVQGTRDMGGGQLLPLFVVARCDFSVIGGGRPSRKYFRGMLGEVDADFMTINNSAKSEIQNYGNAVVVAGVCDPDEQLFSFAAAYPAPAMRQLRRGSKKKKDPLFDGTPV